MARKPPRSQWRLKAGKWMRSLGVRGVRVQLFQNRKDGVFYRAVWLDGKRVNRRSLDTTDREVAERLGEKLVRELLRGDQLASGAAPTLGELWERYSRDCAAFLGSDPRGKREAAGRVQVLLAFYGPGCDVANLSADDLTAFTQKRLSGGILVSRDRTTGSVRMRSVERDLDLLTSMLRWATTHRLPGGQRLLAQNPLAGVPRRREQDPKRPVATWERYLATRVALQKLAAAAAANAEHHRAKEQHGMAERYEAERRRWILVELALVLAEATGRRLGSIRGLSWEDVDLTRRTIRWRAEHDKQGRERIIPIPAELASELQGFRVRLGGAFGGFMFPSPKNPDQPLDRSVFVHALPKAETVAELEKLDGSCWHAYRRKWATERKHMPLKDVAAAGGWRDTATLLTCYQQADDDTVLEVMSCPKKLSERAREA